MFDNVYEAPQKWLTRQASDCHVQLTLAKLTKEAASKRHARREMARGYWTLPDQIAPVRLNEIDREEKVLLVAKKK